MIIMFDVMRWYATFGPVGYLAAPGTMATLVTIPFACWLMTHVTVLWYVTVVAVLAVIAYYCVRRVHNEFFHHEDPSEIVVDEFIGCLITFVGIGCSSRAIILGIILFRFFDISKVAGIRWVERFHGATGIMVDDVLAGVYSNLILHLLNWYGLLY